MYNLDTWKLMVYHYSPFCVPFIFPQKINIPSFVFNNSSCYFLSACHLIFLKVVIVFIWRSFVLNDELLSNGYMICFLNSSRDNILRPFSLILPNSVNLSRISSLFPHKLYIKVLINSSIVHQFPDVLSRMWSGRRELMWEYTKEGKLLIMKSWNLIKFSL